MFRDSCTPQPEFKEECPGCKMPGSRNPIDMFSKTFLCGSSENHVEAGDGVWKTWHLQSDLCKEIEMNYVKKT